MTTKEKIEVMQAYLEGEQIEMRPAALILNGPWAPCEKEPGWDWEIMEYRVKSEPKSPCLECIHYDVCYRVAEDINVDKCEYYTTE